MRATEQSTKEDDGTRRGPRPTPVPVSPRKRARRTSLASRRANR